MSDTPAASSRGAILTSAPHRTMFFCGLLNLAVASAWWALHLAARFTGAPLYALDLRVAPIWAHSFLMLFVVYPAFFFGFLFTTYPRWMNGPEVPRGAYVATGALLATATPAWIAGVHTGLVLQLAACMLAGAGLVTGLVALLRVLIDAEKIVSHAVVTSIALCVGCVATFGFAFGLWTADDTALHFAVRTALWGFLLPVFFAVCHRMVPFFSQGVVPGYVAWRPNWVLVAVVALVYARLLLGTAGALVLLVPVDTALLILAVTCAVRWTSLRSRGNALLWTLYAGFAWLPVALLLQLARDASFAFTGEWSLGRAPVHALGIGFFASMLVAMVTRVTMGHSGRPLHMDRIAVACFAGVQLAATSRVASELVTAPTVVRHLLLCSMALWLLAFAVWGTRHARIYLAPRIDGRPG